MIPSTLEIAVIIPAYNEAITIRQVMEDFHQHCPEAAIYIIDNNSSDDTARIARETYEVLQCRGKLLSEYRQGKAMAVKKAFREIDADIYVMVDADLTYPAADLSALLQPVLEGRADMVCGDRHNSGVYSRENKRAMHDMGNKSVRFLINQLFHGNLHDILTGYRVFTKRFVKNFPILSTGFELETEISIHALDKGYALKEIPTNYIDRPEGSFSKLSTVSDGIKVIKTIFTILMQYRPLLFFSAVSGILMILAILSGLPALLDYIQYEYVFHLPLAVLAVGLAVVSCLSLAVAFILNGLSSAQKNNYMRDLMYWDEAHLHSSHEH